MNFMNSKYTLLSLDYKGTIVAILLGILFFISGISKTEHYIFSIFFVSSMILFLIISFIVTKIGINYKKHLNLYEYKRSIKNVLSNGVPPLIMGLFYFYSNNPLFIIGFSSVVAAIAADKFSSEIGVLNGAPRLILTFKKVKKGVSGGITLLGSLSGLLGSMAVSLFSIAYFYFIIPFNTISLLLIFFILLLSGFCGTIIDSILGYFENKGIGTKHITNFIASLGAGFIGTILFLLIVH